MSIFNKIFEGSKRKGIFKKKGDYSVLTDNYVPASLPTYGQGLENFVTADYPMNNPENVHRTSSFFLTRYLKLFLAALKWMDRIPFTIGWLEDMGEISSSCMTLPPLKYPDLFSYTT